MLYIYIYFFFPFFFRILLSKWRQFRCPMASHGINPLGFWDPKAAAQSAKETNRRGPKGAFPCQKCMGWSDLGWWLLNDVAVFIWCWMDLDDVDAEESRTLFFLLCFFLVGCFVCLYVCFCVTSWTARSSSRTAWSYGQWFWTHDGGHRWPTSIRFNVQNGKQDE